MRGNKRTGEGLDVFHLLSVKGEFYDIILTKFLVKIKRIFKKFAKNYFCPFTALYNKGHQSKF